MQSVFKSTTHAVTSYYRRLCVCAVAACASTRECVCVCLLCCSVLHLWTGSIRAAALYVGDNPPWGVLYTPTSPVSQPAASRSQWNIHELWNQLYPFQPLHSPSLLLNPNPHWQLFMLSRVFLKTNTFKCLFFSCRTTHVEESLSGLHSLMPLLDFWISDLSDYSPKKGDRGLCHHHSCPIMFINLGTMDEHVQVPALTLVLSLPCLIIWYLLATN